MMNNSNNFCENLDVLLKDLSEKSVLSACSLVHKSKICRCSELILKKDENREKKT